MKNRKFLVILILTVIGALVLVLLNFNLIRSILSFQKVDNYPFYVMHYYGDYGLKHYLQALKTVPDSPDNQKNPYSCTCFSMTDPNGNVLFGRNFDWDAHPSLLLFTDPPKGYASVSMVDISYLGYQREDSPGIFQRGALLQAPFMPFDGMNEKGLVVGMMAVSTADSGYDPGRPTLTSLEIIRLILDETANVDEALERMGQYNIDFQGGPPLHYMLADLSGSSVVVEFVDGEMIVLRNDKSWQVSTNFLISQTSENLVTCGRYKRASEMLAAHVGVATETFAFEILQEVSQPETIWSTVYEPDDLAVSISIGGDFSNSYRFSLLP